MSQLVDCYWKPFMWLVAQLGSGLHLRPEACCQLAVSIINPQITDEALVGHSGSDAVIRHKLFLAVRLDFRLWSAGATSGGGTWSMTLQHWICMFLIPTFSRPPCLVPPSNAASRVWKYYMRPAGRVELVRYLVVPQSFWHCTTNVTTLLKDLSSFPVVFSLNSTCLEMIDVSNYFRFHGP